METRDSAIIRRIRELDQEKKCSANISFPVVLGEGQYECKLLSAKGELIEMVQFRASDPFEAANLCIDARNWMAMGKS